MPTPHTQLPPVPSPRYGPALTPLRPQQSFPQPPPTTDPRQLTITLARTPHLRDVHGQQPMKSTRFNFCRYRLHNRLLDTQQDLPEVHSHHPPTEGQTPLCQHTAFYIGHIRQHIGPNFGFHEFPNPLGINTIQGIHVPERISYTSTPPQHTLKPTASSCSLEQLENEHVQEGRDKDLSLECLHFPINLRFTELFRHLSKYFFALADLPNDYLNTYFTRDTAPYKIYAK